MIFEKTAFKSFKSINDIIYKFNNWNTDLDVQVWLNEFGVLLNHIYEVKACRVDIDSKSDIEVTIRQKKNKILKYYLSIKLVSNPNGFNQLDLRWSDDFVNILSIPDDINIILKKFTGEILHKRTDTKDSRRLFFDEFSTHDLNKVTSFFDKNRVKVIDYVIRGYNLTVDYYLVARNSGSTTKYILKDISSVLEFYNVGPVTLTTYGSLKIGLVILQRKGGDGGRETSKMLQFKFNPSLLLKLK